MKSNGSSRRGFLTQTAALAGVAAGAGLVAKGQPVQAAQAQGTVHNEPPKRGARYTIDHMTHYTPLQDYNGVITPSRLHFMQQHTSEFPYLDESRHTLKIYGLVDRPLSFTIADLKRLPSVSRVHFLECHANSSLAIHGNGNENMGLPVQYIHGMTSCSEWTGVPMSVLLREAGLKTTGTWIVNEGGDACNFSHTLPTAKALEDCFVAYGQNGDPLREEQGFPIRMIVPGWEAPFSVKYLKYIKVVDQPYHAWNESMNHSVARPDVGGKSRWYHFAWATKSVITRPSAGMEMRKGYNQITGLAWSGGGAITKVDISTDGGKNWKPAKIQGPVHTKAHTRFTFDWEWNGQEAVMLSRATDDTGDIQPTLAELSKNWGIPMADWTKPDRPRAIHMTAQQPWKINRDGSISDAMFA
jgi:sulfane dehydrogenase subunit SoxC